MSSRDQRPWMIYGACGFTGPLIVKEVLRRGDLGRRSIPRRSVTQLIAAPKIFCSGPWCGRWDSNPHDVAIEGF